MKITEFAIYSTRFDVLAHAVGTMLGQLRSSFPSLPQGESFGKPSESKIAELERENAVLKEAFAKAELLSDPAVAEGHYEYVEVWGYFRPNEIAVVIDRAAFNAARAKETKP